MTNDLTVTSFETILLFKTVFSWPILVSAVCYDYDMAAE